MYRDWHEAFPEFVEVVAPQWPGRENRFSEPTRQTMDELVSVASEIVSTYLDLPFAIFGHSMGAIIAYEVALRLRAGGRPLPIHLFPCAHSAPHLPNRRPHTHDLPAEKLLERLHHSGGVSVEFLQPRDYLDLVLPAVRADLRIIETYSWSGAPPLPVPITAITGSDDSEAPPAELEAWRLHTSSRFQTRVFRGGHFFVREPHGQQLVTRAIVDDLTLTLSLL
jgi:surfactin synthase thioesterase subunit